MKIYFCFVFSPVFISRKMEEIWRSSSFVLSRRVGGQQELGKIDIFSTWKNQESLTVTAACLL